MERKIECLNDCIRCLDYYRCNSTVKIDEAARDFWLAEDEKAAERDRQEKEYAAMIEDITRETEA